MTFEIFKNMFFAINWRNGVGIDLEFLEDKPVWITVMQEDGKHYPIISRFEGIEISLPLIRLSMGRLFEL